MKIINVAKAVVLDADGNVLLLRRASSAPTRPDSWDFPGGGVETGESLDEAVIREANEEAGLEISSPTLLYTATEYVVKLQHSVNRALFVARVDGSKPPIQLSFEHTDYKWVTKSEAVAEFPHPFYGVGLQYALDHGLISS